MDLILDQPTCVFFVFVCSLLPFLNPKSQSASLTCYRSQMLQATVSEDITPGFDALSLYTQIKRQIEQAEKNADQFEKQAEEQRQIAAQLRPLLKQFERVSANK